MSLESFSNPKNSDSMILHLQSSALGRPWQMPAIFSSCICHKSLPKHREKEEHPGRQKKKCSLNKTCSQHYLSQCMQPFPSPGVLGMAELGVISPQQFSQCCALVLERCWQHSSILAAAEQGSTTSTVKNNVALFSQHSSFTLSQESWPKLTEGMFQTMRNLLSNKPFCFLNLPLSWPMKFGFFSSYFLPSPSPDEERSNRAASWAPGRVKPPHKAINSSAKKGN